MRSAEHWSIDGDFVVRVGSVLYRLDKAPLVKHSKHFERVLSVSATDENGERDRQPRVEVERIEGCPVYGAPPGVTPMDFEVLLRLLKDDPTCVALSSPPANTPPDTHFTAACSNSSTCPRPTHSVSRLPTSDTPSEPASSRGSQKSVSRRSGVPPARPDTPRQARTAPPSPSTPTTTRARILKRSRSYACPRGIAVRSKNERSTSSSRRPPSGRPTRWTARSSVFLPRGCSTSLTRDTRCSASGVPRCPSRRARAQTAVRYATRSVAPASRQSGAARQSSGGAGGSRGGACSLKAETSRRARAIRCGTTSWAGWKRRRGGGGAGGVWANSKTVSRVSARSGGG
ncbi:hypothetical protein C8Q79DRAFT_334287 [Trametes meyenii]|nr:hypothetical protein C8Q79DRAFT_334287 [Trametes meyenii]